MMNSKHHHQKFPQSRIASFDVYAVGRLKHHVAALLEVDVTESRKNLREFRKQGKDVSMNAWLIRAICASLTKFPEAAAYLSGRRKLLKFEDINISLLVEREVEDQRVPIPLFLERANERSPEEITREIKEAGSRAMQENDIVLGKKTSFYERMYYYLPGCLRRLVWRYMISRPKLAHRKMGNVVVTSLLMMRQVKGWFIHRSVHPLSFGIGSIIKKPVVIADEIKIREILHMTILLDHDVIDGAPMARFVHDLTRRIEEGGLQG